jgi:hypothetical protein
MLVRIISTRPASFALLIIEQFRGDSNISGNRVRQSILILSREQKESPQRNMGANH